MAFVFLCFNEGGYRGERAVTVTETIQKQEAEGRRVLDELRPQVYKPSFAVRAFAISLIPFLLVCTLNAVYHTDTPPTQQSEESAAPEAADAQTPAPDGDAHTPAAENGVAEEGESEPLLTGNWAYLTARVVMLPFVSLTLLASDAANVYLFFLYSLILPSAALIGYLCGPRLHVRKIKMMQKGSRRKRKALRVNRPPKPPKAEV